jgi:raffinose/stachyose/melibiose transport system permease protein
MTRPAYVRGWLLGLVVLLTVNRLPGVTEIDIPIFSGGFGTAFYEETARKFEALRPGVKVNLYGDPRIWDKVRVRVLSGDYPDATTALLSWPSLIRDGRVVDLAPYLAGPNWEGDARWGDTFVSGALEAWKIDGHTYGLPLMSAAWVLFYNKAIFRAQGWSPPRTWDEFFALSAKMRRAGVAPLSLPGVYMVYGDCLINAAYYNQVGSEGWRRFNAYEPGLRSSPQFYRAADVARRVTSESMIAGWEGMTHTSAQLAFLEGRCAMNISGTWLVHEMEGKFPAGFELGTVNLPVFEDGKTDSSAIQSGANFFFVFSRGQPERLRQTVDFLRFLTSRERADAAVRTIDSPVAVKGVPLDRFSPQMREAGRIVADARETYSAPDRNFVPPGYGQALIDARQQLFTGRITAQQYGDRLEAAAAADRERAKDPLSVKVQHGWATFGLLAGLAGLVLWLGWRGRGNGAGQKSEREHGAYFGPLRGRFALGFVGPSALLFGAFVIVPGLVAFAWAFTNWDGIGARQWVGWFNFKALLLESNGFWAALRNNFFLMIVPTLVVVPLSLFFACLIHRGVWGAKTFRALFLFPNLIGGITATLLWMNAYDPHTGIINAGLVALGETLDVAWLRSFASHPWLSADNLYRSLIPIYIWMGCGFNLILYLAAMEGIDPQLYEAAEMDGAPAWRQFFAITVPMIWEVLVISAVFIVIGGLNAFELVWLLTSQEPGTSSHTLSTLMVTTMFQDFQVGRATAVAVMMFLFVLVGSAAVIRGLKREAIDT